MKNQACKVLPEIINVNSSNPVFYTFSIKKNKCSGNCNNINDPYAKICVPGVVKDLNVKVFNLMQVFAIINSVGMRINVDSNVKN